MATVQLATCQACSRHEDCVLLDNGEQFCDRCLMYRIKDGSMIVMRSNDLECASCGDTIDPNEQSVYDSGCSVDGDYIHDDCVTGCWECGDDIAYVFCSSCMEDHDAERGPNCECDYCGEAGTQPHRCEDCRAIDPGVEAPSNVTVSDSGEIEIDGLQINWS